MSAQTPSDQDLSFLLCEQIRIEQGGKPSLLGLFPGSIIRVPLSASGTLFPSLAFLFVAVGKNAGTFKVSISIVQPSGQVLVRDAPLPEALKKANEPLAIACTISPFQSNEFGLFHAVLKLDNTEYHRTFSVVKDPNLL